MCGYLGFLGLELRNVSLLSGPVNRMKHTRPPDPLSSGHGGAEGELVMSPCPLWMWSFGWGPSPARLMEGDPLPLGASLPVGRSSQVEVGDRHPTPRWRPLIRVTEGGRQPSSGYVWGCQPWGLSWAWGGPAERGEGPWSKTGARDGGQRPG